MILPDTSAWVEFLRRSGHPADTTLDRLLEEDAEVVVSEVVVMELLAGATPGPSFQELRSQLLSLPILPLAGLSDYEEAAAIYRTCRAAGEVVRDITDCMIAVPAIRAGAAVLHADRDFDVIARHTDLAIHPLDDA
ncbi:MAG: PIN domain-containing protein [Actinomycetota bacterium]|nr:PIN domain-containing protein [Actinomycetota bacterium]